MAAALCTAATLGAFQARHLGSILRGDDESGAASGIDFLDTIGRKAAGRLAHEGSGFLNLRQRLRGERRMNGCGSLWVRPQDDGECVELVRGTEKVFSGGASHGGRIAHNRSLRYRIAAESAA